MSAELRVDDVGAQLAGLEQRLGDRFDQIQRRLDALDRRIDHKLAEIRAKQEEDIMLLKALSCQLRGRVERIERRATRGVTS